jgi:hypothetical protein
MDEKFKIKSYGYGELAMLYFPDCTKKSASVQFRRWILFDKRLESELLNAGFSPGKKILTPKQVEIVVAIIGEP